MDLRELEERMGVCLREHERPDEEFRNILIQSQVGDLARYITHDPKLSPSARNHGTPKEEANSFGHTFIQLAGFALARKVGLDSAVKGALAAQGLYSTNDSRAEGDAMQIDDLQRRIAACMKNEDRQDAEFRYAIVASQLGDLARYISHDRKLSPSARPHGSPQEEAVSFGHAFVQLAGLAVARGVPLNEAVETAMKAVEDRDWAKRMAKSEKVEGATAHPGVVEGEVFLLTETTKAHEVPAGKVVVVRYGGPELVTLFGKVIAVVTDDGGIHSHLAILSREHNVPCIMGTGNATKKLAHGMRVRVNAAAEKGFVELL